jgi:zinc transport system ATP-binding protein
LQPNESNRKTAAFTSPCDGLVTADCVLKTTDLTVQIAGRAIVRNATFQLPGRASLAVIGPNGSGKTLLLKTLLGLLPCSGSFWWSPGVRSGYVPQKVSVDPQLPMLAGELLAAKASVQNLSRLDIEAAVEWTGVGHMMEERLGALSTGQLQRVLIALAMLGAPNVLLVDEPTSSLDEAAEESIHELLRRTREKHGTTIILVSHDLAFVHDVATHVLCLNNGVASFGTVATMLTPDILEAVYGRPLQFHAHSLE